MTRNVLTVIMIKMKFLLHETKEVILKYTAELQWLEH